MSVSVNVNACAEGNDSVICVSMRDATKLTGFSRATLSRLAADGSIRKFHCGVEVLFLYPKPINSINKPPAN